MLSKKLVITALIVMFLPGWAIAGQQDVTSEQLNEIQSQLKILKARLDDFDDRLQQNPKTARFDVDFGDDPRLGGRDARIAIVEFSDYQCPFCKRFQTQVFPELKKEYIDTGKIAFIYKDFPLPIHANAKSAAVAANCANEQNDYWNYQEALFSNQAALGRDRYIELAKQHKLDTAKFSTCLDDEKKVTEIESDLAYGSSLGVEGTPSFFIGKIDQSDRIVSARLIVGAQPLPIFKQAIDELLTKFN